MLRAIARKATSPSISRSLFALSCALASITACNTGAVAVQQCRDIETLRCEVSVHCGIIESSQVIECQRFYQDQCLHGIAGDTEPTAAEHKSCISQLREAGTVAQETLDNDKKKKEFDSACAMIASPWENQACEFLVEESRGDGGAGSKDEDEK